MQSIFTCIQYLRYMDGEKHLLFFSGKDLLFPYAYEDYDKGIAAVANDARVIIDTFYTGGLSDSVKPIIGGWRIVGTNWADTAQGQYLRNVAAITGGRASIYQDIGEALERVDQTTRVQYLLGYYPRNENWDGQYRKVDVKVNRPDVKLSFRRGYFARDTVQAYDIDEFRAYSRITAAAGWPEDVKDVSFKLNASKETDAAGKPSVKVNLNIDTSKLVLESADGLYTGKLRIAVYYSDSTQRPLGDLWSTVDLRFREDGYRQYMKSGIPCSIVIPTDRKSLFLAVFVYDMKGDKVGSKRARV